VEIAGELLALTPIKQRGGKTVLAWAACGDCDAAQIRSNTFSMEWPPRSGRMQDFPEVDRAAWFGLEEARGKILPSQTPLLDELARLVPR
jgi:predicted NUDIX family NTP pyrophosphohydrolase